MRAFAFYYTVIDNRIPYQYLGERLIIDEDEFKRLSKENEQTLDKLDYLYRVGYDTSTECSSLILHLLDSVEEVESKAIILSYALWLHSRETSPSKDIDDALRKRIDSRVELQLNKVKSDKSE